MQKFRALKYLIGMVIPLLAWYSFTTYGWQTFLPFIYAFIGIPVTELFIKPNTTNFSKTEEAGRLENVLYDLQIYMIVPIQLATLILFLFSMQEVGLTLTDKIGRITSMGLCCGVLGINVGHELGHRTKSYEKVMAKINLMTSLNMHFMHEHNKHHHKMVSTPEDPATARYGEPLYLFWIRSIAGVYWWAWKLEIARLRKLRVPIFSLRNRMITDHLAELGLLVAIGFFFGLSTVGYFAIAALIGHLVLETVNYIEHYGLVRQKIDDRYERVMPHHSWNSDHIIGRLNLFELSRHSDHHFIASRKYQVLRHMEDSPQMPTGYPGMMILATLPPLWFAVMNNRVRNVRQLNKVAQ